MNNYTRTTLFRMIHRRFLSLFTFLRPVSLQQHTQSGKKGTKRTVPVIPVYIHFFFLNHQTHRMTMRQEMTIRTG